MFKNPCSVVLHSSWYMTMDVFVHKWGQIDLIGFILQTVSQNGSILKQITHMVFFTLVLPNMLATKWVTIHAGEIALMWKVFCHWHWRNTWGRHRCSRLRRDLSHPKRSFSLSIFFFSFSLSILMAENLDDDEFWLSPQFLADDDVVVFPIPFEAKFSPLSNNAVLFPYSSPVDSTVGGSSETESNEEEQLVAELTRHLTRSSLQPDTEAVVWYITLVFLSLLFGVGLWVLFRSFLSNFL